MARKRDRAFRDGRLARCRGLATEEVAAERARLFADHVSYHFEERVPTLTTD